MSDLRFLRIFQVRLGAGRRVFAVLATLLISSGAASAERLGWSLSTTNDSLGDQSDRWRSSSEQLSLVYGKRWSGDLPQQFGDLIELCFRADILTPSNLSAPDPSDRRYANALVFGAHSHWQNAGFEWTAGADLYVIGPQTGLRAIQETLHEALGFPVPNVDGFEISDRLRPSVSVEVARSMSWGKLEVRPFVSGDLGAETLLRAGVDLDWGAVASGDLKLRQVVSGHRVSAVREKQSRGWRATFGGDVAWVGDSVFLPAEGPRTRDFRTRVRAGIAYNWADAQIFYGHTWLGPEFEGQGTGQRVGTLQLTVTF